VKWQNLTNEKVIATETEKKERCELPGDDVNYLHPHPLLLPLRRP
jgi:hypothetical protein